MTALAVVSVCPMAALRPAQARVLSSELAEICLRAVASAPQERVGLAAAAHRDLHDIAASLCDRLGPQASENWSAALLRCAQRDIIQSDVVEVLGQSLMRTEADVLALGARLRARA